jgi:hypothetical protein
MKTTVLMIGIGLFVVAGQAEAAPTQAQKCAAAKLKASAKNSDTKLRVLALAALHGAPVDQAALDKADQDLAAAFAKAEAAGGCATSQDSFTIESMTNSFASTVLMQLLVPIPSFATPTPTGPAIMLTATPSAATSTATETPTATATLTATSTPTATGSPVPPAGCCQFVTSQLVYSCVDTDPNPGDCAVFGGTFYPGKICASDGLCLLP